MKRYKHTLSQSDKNQGAEIIGLDGFLEALKYLEEREQTVIIDTSALKIAKTAFLAGFNIEEVGETITLTASVSLDRELAVYALSAPSLVELFKKYFKK